MYNDDEIQIANVDTLAYLLTHLFHLELLLVHLLHLVRKRRCHTDMHTQWRE